MEQISRNTKEIVLKWMSVAILMLCISGTGSAISWLTKDKRLGSAKLSPVLVPYYIVNCACAAMQIHGSWFPGTLFALKLWISVGSTALGCVMLFVDAILVPGAVYFDGAWQLIVLIALQGVWAIYARDVLAGPESLPFFKTNIKLPFHTPIVLLSQIILGLTLSGVILSIATPIGMVGMVRGNSWGHVYFLTPTATPLTGWARVPIMGVIYILTITPATILLFIYCMKSANPGHVPVPPYAAVLLSVFSFALSLTSVMRGETLYQNLYFTVGTWFLQSLLLIIWTIFLFLGNQSISSPSEYTNLSSTSEIQVTSSSLPVGTEEVNLPGGPVIEHLTEAGQLDSDSEPIDLPEEIHYAAKVISWASLPFTIAFLGGGIYKLVFMAAEGFQINILAWMTIVQTGFNIYEIVSLSRSHNLKALTRVAFGAFIVAILSGLSSYAGICDRSSLAMYTYIVGGLVGIIASMRLASAVVILTYPSRSLLKMISCGSSSS
jgi:hypothetical protein